MTNKIALVTGGSRGLGRSSALALSQKGYGIIITYRTQKEKADEVISEIKKHGGQAAALQLDTGLVSSFDDFVSSLIDVLKEKWNRDTFDYLVNNAGVGISAPFANTTEEQFDSLVNVHFKGVYFLTQKLLPLLADNGGIVNVSSGLTRFTTEGNSAYAAVKGAIEVFTRSLAKELGSRGIRVNTVAPGPMATDFGGGIMRDNENLKAFIGSVTALGRVGEADDISGVIASLCTDEMRWVTAQRIEASGGMSL
ncbi:SDR family NAD(P)-dependent oxidoreductase [Priestia megaterium]|uniref:SDR family NAD(P)-dependent oxidoreductase n=1 Tax=Priestia megaterium TaxID=1404 RepID=UPI00207A05C1|nr:SDR family oxidoreductase [Priestia megaterium]USL27464.1 SDR family oxidoreductase [Priestia megaterium]USL33496.1 SDR family oxidoreductase [Priestia megaterium]USL39431.1 SDR family oxidoreductase [Priestia megaterium]WDM31578.1 SDR family oxidoreductase [Priestia megaterium]